MVSQIAGMVLEAKWRWILLFGAGLAICQLILLPLCVDSPRYLMNASTSSHQQRDEQAKQALLRLRGPPVEDVVDEIEEWHRDAAATATTTTTTTTTSTTSPSSPLMPDENDNNIVTLRRFLTFPQYRHPLLLILLVQLSQQFSGINAVIFYSTSIMSTVFPESSDRITVFIAIVNLAMTVVSAYLMDRSGRRTLFLVSSSAMACSSLLLGWSIQYGYDGTSAFAIVSFVAAFAIGLGPIPFLIIPELVVSSAAASAGSVGLASNMLMNFTVSAGFMALRDIIGQGQVFYVFALILLVCTLLGFFYLPETKNKSADQVVRSGWAVPSWSWKLRNQQQEDYHPIQDAGDDL
ncbi:unnamed protein product [Absidia cylindrospora]